MRKRPSIRASMERGEQQQTKIIRKLAKKIHADINNQPLYAVRRVCETTLAFVAQLERRPL